MYGLPVAGGLRQRVRRDKKLEKWVCSFCHGIEGEYLKRTMCVCVASSVWELVGVSIMPLLGRRLRGEG